MSQVQQPRMTPVNALQILSDLTAKIQMQRPDHLAVIQALDVLAEACGCKPGVLAAVPPPEGK